MIERGSGSPGQAARIPRPVAAIVVSAIVGATLLALFRPVLPWESGAAPDVIGQTRVGVIVKQTGEGAGRINERAPDFEWIAPDGRRRSLGTLGRPAVVNFWATWCEPCKREMPLLERTAAARTDLAFLAVDLDEDGGTVRAFFDELSLTSLEPLIDVGLETSRRYGLASVPTTFFVDAGGTIRHMHIGEMDQEKLQRGLDRLR